MSAKNGKLSFVLHFSVDLILIIKCYTWYQSGGRVLKGTSYHILKYNTV